MILNNIDKLLLLLFVATILTGCWDLKSIDEKAFVVAIGLDKAKENRIKVSYLIENPLLSSQQGKGSDVPPRKVVSFIANDFIAAKDTADTITTNEITYDMLRFIFISEQFAEEENLIRWMYDAAKEMEIRRDTKLIVTKEQVSDYFLKNEPVFDQKPHRYYDLIFERVGATGMIPRDSQLLYYYRITEADADLFLTPYTTTEIEEKNRYTNEDQFLAGEKQLTGILNNTQAAGSAVFKEGKMIGKITGEETRLATMLNNTLEVANILTTFPDPFDERYRIATRMKSNKSTKIKMNLKKETPSIDVTVPLEVDVLTNHSMTPYWGKDIEKRETVKRSIEEDLKAKLEEFIKKTQEELKGNPFGWSLQARKQFKTNKEYIDFNWMEKYPTMNISVSVEVKLGSFGRQSVVPKLKDVRD
ncbi:Ger(x)C family spore germination protein [Virgibacillus sp. W0430]|uniref:Ger(x)C family spore germination protein n=1 Tax=Virgibacillus sp. W0430 TaxID=3391580 RepID=UPI003F467289